MLQEVQQGQGNFHTTLLLNSVYLFCFKAKIPPHTHTPLYEMDLKFGRAAEQPCRQILCLLGVVTQVMALQISLHFLARLPHFLEKVPIHISHYYFHVCSVSSLFYQDFWWCYQFVQVWTVLPVEHTLQILHGPCTDGKWWGPPYSVFNSEMWSFSLQMGALWLSLGKYAWQMHFFFKLQCEIFCLPCSLLLFGYIGRESWTSSFLLWRFPTCRSSSGNSGGQ